MDALITKEGVEITLSSLGVLVTDFEDSSPTVLANQRTVNNRNGYAFMGATHQSKRMTISGYFYAENAYEIEEIKDELNGLLSNTEPFYLTKMLPNEELYQFELPGQKVGDLELLSMPHTRYKYRYKVIVEEAIDYEFAGKSDAGFLVSFSFIAKTAELPYGETEPVSFEVTNNEIQYAGTAKCSQLEWPWYLRLTAVHAQSGEITITIGGRTFMFYAVTPLQPGDVLIVKGIETTLNGTNVNDHTNYEHLVLLPSLSKKNKVSTNFTGKMEILNKVDLYK